jgi:hypothetical protein
LVVLVGTFFFVLHCFLVFFLLALTFRRFQRGEEVKEPHLRYFRSRTFACSMKMNGSLSVLNDYLHSIIMHICCSTVNYSYVFVLI